MHSKKLPLAFSEKSVLKIIRFLEKQKLDYFILGGLAVGVLGEPRFTQDLDLDLFLKKESVSDFLKQLQKAKFQIKVKEALSTAKIFGSFYFFCNDLQVDIILASTSLEQEALKRKRQITLFGKKMYFPSPEDLILLKLVPARPKDLIDAETIALSHKGKLDKKYLLKEAEKLCEEAEDFKLMHRLNKILELK